MRTQTQAQTHTHRYTRATGTGNHFQQAAACCCTLAPTWSPHRYTHTHTAATPSSAVLQSRGSETPHATAHATHTCHTSKTTTPPHCSSAPTQRHTQVGIQQRPHAQQHPPTTCCMHAVCLQQPRARHQRFRGASSSKRHIRRSVGRSVHNPTSLRTCCCRCSGGPCGPHHRRGCCCAPGRPRAAPADRCIGGWQASSETSRPASSETSRPASSETCTSSRPVHRRLAGRPARRGLLITHCRCMHRPPPPSHTHGTRRAVMTSIPRSSCTSPHTHIITPAAAAGGAAGGRTI